MSKNKLTKFEKKILDSWKPIMINGIYTSYEISDIGQVINTKTNTIKSQLVDKNGYRSVHLYINGKRYSKFIHQLVAQAFIPNPENKPYVNHINPDPSKNTVDNLEWCTQKENIQHCIDLGRKLTGDDCSFAKYSENQIRHVCKLLEEDKSSISEISKITNVHNAIIWNIKANISWKHISKDYKISPPISDRKGEEHHSAKCTDDQIRRVCKMLENPKIPFIRIIEEVGVTKSLINNVVQKKAWVHISSEYTIPERERSIRSSKILERVS